MDTSKGTELTVECPTCGQKVLWSQAPFKPFCSERCKMIDFGQWANEENSIPGDPAEDDVMSDRLH